MGAGTGKEKPDDAYVDEPEKIRVARYWVGNVGFELMESTSPDGEVAKFIEKRGEGIMLISLNVDNTREAITNLNPSHIHLSVVPDRSAIANSPLFTQTKMNGVLLSLNRLQVEGVSNKARKITQHIVRYDQIHEHCILGAAMAGTASRKTGHHF